MKLNSELDRACEIIQKKEKRLKSKDRISEQWITIKKNNLQVIEVPEGEEKEKEAECLFKEIMMERLVQDGGVEGCALTPYCESTGITTNC